MTNQSLNTSFCLTPSCPMAHHQSRKHIFSDCHVPLPSPNVKHPLSSQKHVESCFVSIFFDQPSNFRNISNGDQRHVLLTWDRPPKRLFLKNPLHWFLILLPPLLLSASRLQRLKSSSMFGDSLRLTPRTQMKATKAKNNGASAMTKCEIGQSLLVLIPFGDEQLAVDMLADKLLFEALQYSHVCKYACSEEVPELQDMGGPVEGGFSVAFDPLDGSSIVDTNFTVGTIFGVWPVDKLTGVTRADQVAAAMVIYGPRTTYGLAVKRFLGTHEFLLLDEALNVFTWKWQHVKETTEINEGKMFSPGNLRATFDNSEYTKIIVKEKGIFTNVTSPTAKAKLRLLFEVAPLSLLIENLSCFMAQRTRSSALKKPFTDYQDSRMYSKACFWDHKPDNLLSFSSIEL
ncbi:unnamed protein product [Eruca vesicaria subsp. sativa]|uniref:Uncharacterized protein n=1 Tax=Eruca vesicaria subsp. sativa TaxID=29727 RepID=A0ABC8K014_ERUVS|nr:unnamed protein product [Eruca vesicaria subsp. sativa]